MNDFTMALKAGREAAEIELGQQNDIKKMLKELAESVELESNKYVTAEVQFRGISTSNSAIENISFFLSSSRYKALVLKPLKRKDQPVQEIAKWKQDGRGFPCAIMIGGDEFICEDAIALRMILKRIMSSSTVWLKIRNMEKLQTVENSVKKNEVVVVEQQSAPNPILKVTDQQPDGDIATSKPSAAKSTKSVKGSTKKPPLAAPSIKEENSAESPERKLVDGDKPHKRTTVKKIQKVV